MNDYKDMKNAIEEHTEINRDNKDNGRFIENLIKSNQELKNQKKKLEEENKTYYDHAVQKISELKRICKEVLGWEVRVKQGFVEMKNVYSVSENDLIILKTIEDQAFEILENDYTRDLFSLQSNLGEIMKVSYPLLFSYICMLMKPEIKELYFVY